MGGDGEASAASVGRKRSGGCCLAFADEGALQRVARVPSSSADVEGPKLGVIARVAYEVRKRFGPNRQYGEKRSVDAGDDG